MTVNEPVSLNPAGRPALNRPSWPLIAGALALVIAGAATGLGTLVDAPRPVPVTSPDDTAWPAHIALGAVLLAFLVLRVRFRGWRALLTPMSARAGRRLRAGLTERSPRAVASLALAALLAYLAFRMGMQLTAGLDPAFTANAWGGPTYLGALLCHAIDAALISLIAVTALHLLLPAPAHPRRFECNALQP
ncbi:hypothetical protein EK0264_14680 [Epidermidibacterium keratini]|uniref:Uncharacterized protein n=1 Tax=Epidermidibacterium keratini TaxID=1891644 RepID=A0A7L4YQ62_9ACTN|nr:hypothetical protein [Epidermidibacterium keratini]QHC01411.1 hypothetical protein EK0264_14680 [Epidermidibacterium keratini]